MFPEKQKRGFRVHRNKENEILDALLKGRALPGLHASQTPKGVQILGGRAGSEYAHPWKITARVDDGTGQVAVRSGRLRWSLVGHYQPEYIDNGTDNEAWPNDDTPVWVDLPGQTSSVNYVWVEVEWQPFENQLGGWTTYVDTADGSGGSDSYDQYFWTPTVGEVKIGTSFFSGLSVVGESSTYLEKIQLGSVTTDADGVPSVDQVEESTITLPNLVVASGYEPSLLGAISVTA